MSALPELDPDTRAALGLTVPERIDRLVTTALFDLWHGPVQTDDEDFPWPGFSEACDEISRWADCLPGALFFEDWSGCYFTEEPDCREDVLELSQKDTLALVLGLEGRTGRELLPYL